MPLDTEEIDSASLDAPDDGVPEAILYRLDSLERKVDQLVAFAQKLETALEQLRNHPMLGKLVGGNGE